MKIAITGGAGFVGRHLAERFDAADIVTVSRRTGVDIEDVEALTRAFDGCEVVAHCAGINREIGKQTYQKVHIDGTRTVIEAARRAGVTRIVMLSFLRARPDCGSPYHESKWAAEELLRNSGLDYTILKAGMIYGHGDHLVDHVSHSVQTIPLFATVGFREKSIRPIPVSEMVDVLVASIEGKLPKSTVAVTGGEELMLSEVVHRVAQVVGRRVAVVLPFKVRLSLPGACHSGNLQQYFLGANHVLSTEKKPQGKDLQTVHCPKSLGRPDLE